MTLDICTPCSKNDLNLQSPVFVNFCSLLQWNLHLTTKYMRNFSPHVSFCPALIMVALWNRQTIIFLPCDFYLSSFFPRLISAVGDWMSPYFHTWCGLSANLEYMSEMCCTRLAENTGRKKIAIWSPLHNFVGLYLRN